MKQRARTAHRQKEADARLAPAVTRPKGRSLLFSHKIRDEA